MKKIGLIFLIILIVAAGLLAVRFIFGGSEDDWICKNGQWVKHGNPASPAPESGCGDEVDEMVDCSSFLPADCPEKCIVCPPCIECSSINCQTEEFCQRMGIGREWYEEIKKRIDSFEKCVAAGNPVMESYPRQCRANGQTFAEDIGNELEKINLIMVDYPRPNQIISSPLQITGQARGFWFFEASFPIKLLDEKGNTIASAIAQAQDEWMTEDFVPFTAELEFDAPAGKSGILILEKDNPSDLPQNADELHLPVIFENQPAD